MNTSITILPMTVVCFSASPITMTARIASTSMGLTSLGQHDALLPQLIPRDTIRGSVGLTVMLQ